MTVQRPGDSQRLAQTPRPCRQRPSAAPPVAHRVLSLEGLEAANEHGLRVALPTGDHVHAPVHPIASVHVGVSARPEHDLVTARPSSAGGGVGCRVFHTPVGFHLDDHTGRAPIIDGGHEPCAEESAGNLEHPSIEEPGGEESVRSDAQAPGGRRSASVPRRRTQF